MPTSCPTPKIFSLPKIPLVSMANRNRTRAVRSPPPPNPSETFEFPKSPAISPTMCAADDVISGGKLLPFRPPRAPPAKIGGAQVAASPFDSDDRRREREWSLFGRSVSGSGYRKLTRREPEMPDPLRRNKPRWYVLAFGSMKVPAAMVMKEIRIRQQRRAAAAAAGEEKTKEGWGPWKLLRSLSCKGVEVAGGCHRRIVL